MLIARLRDLLNNARGVFFASAVKDVQLSVIYRDARVLIYDYIRSLAAPVKTFGSEVDILSIIEGAFLVPCVICCRR